MLSDGPVGPEGYLASQIPGEWASRTWKGPQMCTTEVKQHPEVSAYYARPLFAGPASWSSAAAVDACTRPKVVAVPARPLAANPALGFAAADEKSGTRQHYGEPASGESTAVDEVICTRPKCAGLALACVQLVEGIFSNDLHEATLKSAAHDKSEDKAVVEAQMQKTHEDAAIVLEPMVATINQQLAPTETTGEELPMTNARKIRLIWWSSQQWKAGSWMWPLFLAMRLGPPHRWS